MGLAEVIINEVREIDRGGTEHKICHEGGCLIIDEKLLIDGYSPALAAIFLSTSAHALTSAHAAILLCCRISLMTGQ